MSVATGMPGYVPPSGSTAKTLILVGLILQLVFGLIFLIGFGVVAAVSATVGVFPIFALVWIIFGALGFIWLFLVWIFSYKPVSQGQYEQARTPTLVFAILSLVTLGIISFVLYLIAYIKLGDAIREAQTPPAGYYGAPGMAPPMGGMAPPMGQPMASPMAQPMGQTPAAPVPGAAPSAPVAGGVICPRCGQPATYVAQYNRYYCYRDQQYV